MKPLYTFLQRWLRLTSLQFTKCFFLMFSSFVCRTCVNGSLIDTRTALRHGDRILLGNYHFFRINCPRPPGAGMLTREPWQHIVFWRGYSYLSMINVIFLDHTWDRGQCLNHESWCSWQYLIVIFDKLSYTPLENTFFRLSHLFLTTRAQHCWI